MQSYEVERLGFGIDSTLSRFWNITDGGRIALCWGIEDERRETKVFAETCIPTGTYELALRTHGGFHERYKLRFPDMHIGMIQVMGVPNFSDILLHIGNDEGDTAGCYCVGLVPVIIGEGGGDFEVGRSTDAYRKIYPMITTPLAEGERCVVTYLERRPYE